MEDTDVHVDLEDNEIKELLVIGTDTGLNVL